MNAPKVPVEAVKQALADGIKPRLVADQFGVSVFAVLAAQKS